MLRRAHTYATSTGADPWFFAIDRDTLEQAGLIEADLRWLIAAGYALHADELTHPTDAQRRFAPAGLARLSRATCFTLTEQGAAALENLLTGPSASSKSGTSVSQHQQLGDVDSLPCPLPDCVQTLPTPRWDGERRELTLGEMIIKSFRVPARNQELLLAAFEEQNWPHGIDDPLVPVPDQDPKERLKAAIRCLNRNQRAKLIRFRGNGNGKRIYWELRG
ncbi:MAG TPA: hypothetical protein VGN12_24920 [Pirellulales bacterium]|jgi:hypothetical protein